MRSSKPRLLAQLAYAVAAICVFASPAFAKDKERDLKAVIAFTETIVSSNPCPLLGSFSGVGQASYVGRVTVAVAQDCIVPLDTSMTLFQFNAIQPLVLQAVNGDQLVGTYRGKIDFSTGIGMITGTFEITGGSGRFANANGKGTVTGVEAISVDPLGRMVGQGIIQLDGALSD